MLATSHYSIAGRIGAYVQKSRHDPVALTTEARKASTTALNTRLLAEVDPEGVLPEDERARRLEYARRAHFARLALASAKARRKKGA